MKEFYRKQLLNEYTRNKRLIVDLQYRQDEINDELKVLDGLPTREQELMNKIKTQTSDGSIEIEAPTKAPTDLDEYADYLMSQFQQGTTPLLGEVFDFMGALTLIDPDAAQPYLNGAKNIDTKLLPLNTELAVKEGIKNLSVVVGLIKGRKVVPETYTHKINPESQKKINEYKTRVNPKLVDFMLTRKPLLKEIGQDLSTIYKGLEGAV